MWCGWVQGNSDGPLVPMVRLVPMEKHPIPIVLLVTMHLIKGIFEDDTIISEDSRRSPKSSEDIRRLPKAAEGDVIESQS